MGVCGGENDSEGPTEPRKLTLIPYRTDQRNLSHHLRRPFMCIVIGVRVQGIAGGGRGQGVRGIACARRVAAARRGARPLPLARVAQGNAINVFWPHPT